MRLTAFVTIVLLMCLVIPSANGLPQIVVTIYTNSMSYNPGESVTLNGYVKDITGFPVPSATVSIQVNKPDGSPLHLAFPTLQTDGSYLDTFSLPVTAGDGTYTVYVTAYKYEWNPGNSFAMFLVPRTSLAGTVTATFSDTSVTLGFMKTGNIYDDSGIGFIYAHRSPPRILFPKTDTNRVLPTGQPSWSGYTHLVTVGGRAANPTTKYYEDNGLAPLRWAGTSTVALIMRGSEVKLNVPLSSINQGNDYFVMEVVIDGTHKVIILWGIQQWGTYAAGVYFDGKWFGDMASLTAGWYIIRWQDLNGNGTPDYETEFTIVASGS